MVKQTLSALAVSGLMLSGAAFAADTVKTPGTERSHVLPETMDQGAAKAGAIEKTGTDLKNAATDGTVREKADKAVNSGKNAANDAVGNSVENTGNTANKAVTNDAAKALKAEQKAEKPVKDAAKKAAKSKMN